MAGGAQVDATPAVSKLGPTGGIARQARPGHVGRARSAARGSRPDVGIAHLCAARRRERPCADLGIAAATGGRSAAGRRSRGRPGRSELGSPGARSSATTGSPGACRCSGLGRRCTSPVMGRAAAGFRASSAGSATTRATRAACPSRTRSRPAGSAGPVVGRRSVRSARAGMGGACRCRVTHPDGAVVEPSGSSLDSSAARGPGSRGARGLRLGCTARRATTDRGARMDPAGVRVLGCSQDRGTRGSRGPVVVRGGLSARRAAAHSGAVEPAGGGRSASAPAVVASRAGRARATAQRH